MILSSLCILFWTSPETVLQTMIGASADALKHTFELIGVYAVWLGILELVDASGLGEKLARLLRPIIKKLFHTKDEDAQKKIAMNISANMLGLGNAATPMGIEAMKKLDDKSGIATEDIIMLIVLNATSIQLLPTTIIGLRSSAGSVSPADIIIPTLIATALTCFIGISLVKIIQKFNRKRKRG